MNEIRFTNGYKTIVLLTRPLEEGMFAMSTMTYNVTPDVLDQDVRPRLGRSTRITTMTGNQIEDYINENVLDEGYNEHDRV